MDELRLHSTVTDYLVLESRDGTRHRLAIDDSLRAALRHSSSAVPGAIKLTPREIQTAIRSGSSVEKLITNHGDPRDYVEKFAQPVLDELAHVLATALSVRISIAGDRYNEVSHLAFGDIISSRLDASGVSDLEWVATRSDNQAWQVSVRYTDNGSQQSAIWSFDIKKLLLSPENDNAITLSTQNSLKKQEAPKLKPVVETPVQNNVDTQALPETQRLDSVIPIGRAADRVVTESPATKPAADISKSADLLDALKKKREERASAPQTQTIEIIDAAPDSIGEESQDPEEVPTPIASPVRRSGRPSIPSFDEIVQGTKSDE